MGDLSKFLVAAAAGPSVDMFIATQNQTYKTNSITVTNNFKKKADGTPISVYGYSKYGDDGCYGFNGSRALWGTRNYGITVTETEGSITISCSEQVFLQSSYLVLVKYY